VRCCVREKDRILALWEGREGRKGIESLFKSRVEQRGAHRVQRAEQRGMEHRERGKMFMKMNDCDHQDHPIA
jgi:hypothetical protein